jgi:hypothetical protein
LKTFLLLQLQLGASLTWNVRRLRPAWRSSARIPVGSLLSHAGPMQSARQGHIVQSASAQLGLLATRTQNATNVRLPLPVPRNIAWQFYSLKYLLVDECVKDEDCPFTKACVRQECVDPCLQTACGNRAQCSVEYHKARCTCPSGLQGNPLVSCEEVGCRTDNDCQDNQKCDYNSRSCVALCTQSPCATGATCQARNHKETCTCNPPLQGDGYSFCEKRKAAGV